MKWLITGMLFIPMSTLAQGSAPESVEGANVLAVSLADSGAVALERVAQVLAGRGYRVQTRYPTGLRLETEPLLAENLHCLASVQVTIMGHTALLSGEGFCELYSHRPRPLIYSTRSRVPVANYDCFAWGWAEMERVALALTGKKTVYFHHP